MEGRRKEDNGIWRRARLRETEQREWEEDRRKEEREWKRRTERNRL